MIFFPQNNCVICFNNIYWQMKIPFMCRYLCSKFFPFKCTADSRYSLKPYLQKWKCFWHYVDTYALLAGTFYKWGISSYGWWVFTILKVTISHVNYSVKRAKISFIAAKSVVQLLIHDKILLLGVGRLFKGVFESDVL